MNKARRQIYALNTRVFVTGGAGFLGSHFCDRLIRVCLQTRSVCRQTLIKEKCDILCLDNFFTGQKKIFPTL